MRALTDTGVTRRARARRRACAALAVLALAAPTAHPAAADCATGDCIPGGGPADGDCVAEFQGPGLRLNYPPFDPSAPAQRPRRQIRCFDGEAGCDTDGAVNGACVFEVSVCLANTDPELPACTPPGQVSEVEVARRSGSAGALQSAIDAILPASGGACTSGESVTVPLRQSASGRQRKGRATVRLRAEGDVDRLQLVCVPHGWPSHGYDYANTRATPVETAITPQNVDTLQMIWDFPTTGAVTATPTVTEHLVYVASWDGFVYALRRDTGAVVWSFDTGTEFVSGVQSTVTVAADGRVAFGDSIGRIYVLDGRGGAPLWQGTVGDTDPLASHVWASPTLANGRVFLGRASHNDNPCTQGHLYAFDFDTGAELWRFKTVPDGVCSQDTTQECAADVDCGAGNTCEPGVGGGVTATAATDAGGETVYMASVGCFTFPSIGSSDSIFSLNAADGGVNWITRTQTVEQFQPGIDYHDYGFLNGPIVMDDGQTQAIVAAGKDGVIYARDPVTGGEVWTNVVEDVMGGFAAFGLFNGAPAFADGRIIASLGNFADPIPNIDHLRAFSTATGAEVWGNDVDIGASWSSMAVANGVVFTGTIGADELYAYDAATGARLATFALPEPTTSGPAVVDGTLYIGYGIFGSGGARAYRLPPSQAAQ